MTTLEDITEHLLNRAQEAVLQLEQWISNEQNLQQPDSSCADDELKDTYSLYVAQLNSLCVRSEYVMNKLNKKQLQRSSNCINNRYIGDLVYEFQDITVRLNDLAMAQNKDTTPSSKSSKCSWDSFQPKPLKISERHRAYMEAAQLSPIKKEKISKKMVSISEPDDSQLRFTKCVSLPGSPVKELRKKTIRLAKSYDTGLNGKSTSQSSRNRNDVKLFFKENQRLSISLFEECDKDEDYMSDQDTVISISPLREKKAIPLRRYNSHESILSIRKQESSSGEFLPSFFHMKNYGPSKKSVRISSEPVFSRASKPACSRELLSTFVRNSSELPKLKQPEESSSFFARWNPFSSKSNIEKKETIFHDIKQRKPAQQMPVRNGINDSSKASKVTPLSSAPSLDRKIPVLDCLIAYDDLREALNTELIL